jgi:hypothetical protein
VQEIAPYDGFGGVTNPTGNGYITLTW